MEDLKELEHQTLEEIDVVVAQLDPALASLSNHDIELAELVVATEARIDARCLAIPRRAVAARPPNTRRW